MSKCASKGFLKPNKRRLMGSVLSNIMETPNLEKVFGAEIKPSFLDKLVGPRIFISTDQGNEVGSRFLDKSVKSRRLTST